MSWRSMMMATAVANANPRLGGADVRAEITDGDLASIRDLLSAQLTAFRAGDGEVAFALSSPAIRDTFGSPERLLEVIRRRYAPLTDAHQVEFGEIVITPDGLAQVIVVLDGTGDLHHAVYLLDRLDGRWITNGCLMAPPMAQAA